jgi:hypothetical protein
MQWTSIISGDERAMSFITLDNAKILWQQVRSQKWNAAGAAIKFIIFGNGSANVALKDVRKGGGQTAFIATIFTIFVLAVAVNMFLDTLGEDYVSRLYEVGDEDGLQYLWPQIGAVCLAALVFWVIVLICTSATDMWLGKRYISPSFWAALSIPAMLMSAFLSLALHGLPFLIPPAVFDIISPPFDGWLVFFIVLSMVLGTMIVFGLLASKRFSQAFLVTLTGFKARVRLYASASLIFMMCFVSISGVGESLKRVEGNPVADSIRVGSLKAVSATTMACQTVGGEITCAVTVWPEKFQQYTFFGAWKLGYEIEHNKTGTTVSEAGMWSPIEQMRVLPWVQIGAAAPVDILVRAQRAEVCAVPRESVAKVRFEVVARAATSRLKQRSQLLVDIVNQPYFISVLHDVCR